MVSTVQIKVVDIGQDTNVGVGILHRDALASDGGAVRGIVHTQVTEVYYIISGSGVLVTGGTLEDAQEIPADSPIVTEIVGPSKRGTSRTGHSRRVSEGDVVVIPAGLFHGWAEIEGSRHLPQRTSRPPPDPSRRLRQPSPRSLTTRAAGPARATVQTSGDSSERRAVPNLLDRSAS